MSLIQTGDLVVSAMTIEYELGSSILARIPSGTFGIVKMAGPTRASVKFVGFRRCTVFLTPTSETRAASTLDKLAWDFGEMDEHPVNESGGGAD
jgi:hypothetical protein